MSDRYLKFANGSIGKKLVNALGLPKPLPLERYKSGATTIEGSVLVGGNEDAELLNSLALVFKSMQARTVTHSGLPLWDKIAADAGLTNDDRANTSTKDSRFKALVFDATGLRDSAQSDAIFQFFHDSARALHPCARVVVLGRPPEACESHRKATVQRSLEGLTRSLGKELRRGSTVQLVYVANGAEDNLESTLRFLLSPRSAYVSGQVIRVSQAVGRINIPVDWNESLAGKKVLVTGASRGIGEAIADTMARVGAQVIVLDIPQAEKDLAAVATRIGASSLALDISTPDAPEQLKQHALDVGGWDVIIHNAGITRDKTIAKMSREVWQQVLNVNLTAQERINEVLVEGGAIKENGRIICVSSISGIAGNIGQTNYAMSKAGVIGMVESSAPVFADKNITINAVAPGFIETQMTAAVPFAIREAGRRMNSLSQGGQAVDVAEAIVWLASPASSGINGNVLRVCGQSLLGA